MSFVNVAITGMNAMQQIQSGRITNEQGQARGSWMDYQADVEQQGALETARIIRRAGQRVRGQAVGAAAASGVKVGEGSALEAQDQITRDSEHDAFQALLDGGRRARGLQVDAATARANGRAAQAAAYSQAVGTVLSGSYQAMRANGWRTAGPGFSGTQMPAPVVNRDIPRY